MDSPAGLSLLEWTAKIMAAKVRRAMEFIEYGVNFWFTNMKANTAVKANWVAKINDDVETGMCFTPYA